MYYLIITISTKSVIDKFFAFILFCCVCLVAHGCFTLPMLQVYDIKKEGNTTTESVLRPYFRVNLECETDFESCIYQKQLNCNLQRQTNHDSMTCVPSQLSSAVEHCNQQNSTQKYKICDGAFEWCNEGAPVIPELRKIESLDMECYHIVAKECDLRHRCFQRCLQKRQSIGCNFFAMNTKSFRASSKRINADCQTFSHLNETEFSSSSCGPWKVYQMNCVDGLCDHFDVIPRKESASRPYFRVNLLCGTDFEICPWTQVNCRLQRRQPDKDNPICIPSQLRSNVDACNQKNSLEKYKICDGAFEWCTEGVPAMSMLRRIEWLTHECRDTIIAKECDLRHRCFQQCRRERQSGKCNFFAINTKKFTSSSKRQSIDNCRTFSTLDGTGFSSSSCGPWKVYQMSCVDGACNDLDAIASTAASPVKAEYSTTVSCYIVCFNMFHV